MAAVTGAGAKAEVAGGGAVGTLLHALSRAATSDTAQGLPKPVGQRRLEWACCNRGMWLLLLEALGALLIFVFIIWWTMFSGRKGGERRDDAEPPPQ